MEGISDCLKLVACSPNLEHGSAAGEKGNHQGWNIDQASRPSSNESV